MTSKPAPPESARRALSGGAGLEVIGQPQRENEAGVPDPENDHLKRKTQCVHDTTFDSSSGIEIIKIPSPNDLYCTIVHPKIEVKTSYSRSILPNDVSLEDATKQLANFGSLIHGLHTSDYDLIKSSLNDHLIEKHRSKLIPKFQEIKSECLSNGALGCSISGSGPSIFALSRGIDSAKHVEQSINRVYSGSGLEFSTYVSKINDRGVEII